MQVSLLEGNIAALASFILGTLIINGSTDVVYGNALNHLKYETNIKSLQLASDIKPDDLNVPFSIIEKLLDN